MSFVSFHTLTVLSIFPLSSSMLSNVIVSTWPTHEHLWKSNLYVEITSISVLLDVSICTNSK